ncbi:MAG TPA: hypothetical protein VM733_04685 [Thermoanaerobaculia bacterium]|nr:hypothetical protein [Thermoanaerobaculia bacterium]
MKRFAFATLLCLWGNIAVLAQTFTVQDEQVIDLTAGEGQSAVVPVGAPPCPAGRIIASTEQYGPEFGPAEGKRIAYRDLTGPNTATKFADVAKLPNSIAQNYRFGTSDHDLVAFRNGEVYLLMGAFSKSPLGTTPPSWFAHAYRTDFGPGARSTLLVWKSTDCGAHFTPMPNLEMDSAQAGDKTCAFPQGQPGQFHEATGTKYVMRINAAAPVPGAEVFRRCTNCQQLYREGGPTFCPFGLPHWPTAERYILDSNDVSGHVNETNYRVCNTCGTVYRAGTSANACSLQTHTADSANYFLVWDAQHPNMQTGWRWCAKCQTAFGASAASNECARGGTHDLVNAYQIALSTVAGIGDPLWAQCSKCQGAYKIGATGDSCPSGGTHDDSGVHLKVFTQLPTGIAGQSGWRRCTRCGLLFYGNNQAASRCPLVRQHDGAGSPDYHMAVDKDDGFFASNMQNKWRTCVKCGSVWSTDHYGGSCPIHKAGDEWIYDMGGSDGQLARADLARNQILLTFQCVGRVPDPGSAKFALSNTSVNKTVVAKLDAGAASWTILPMLPTTGWRMGLVPFDDNTFAIGSGFSDYLVRATKSNGVWSYGQQVKEPAANQFGYDGLNSSAAPYSALQANIHAHTILTRTPGTAKATMIMPDTIPGKGHGYRIFFEGSTIPFREAAIPITPATKNPNDVAFHLQAIHLDFAGPALLYWYDFNSVDRSITIRGRFILGDGKYTPDFTISQQGGGAQGFDASNGFWYGDYQTAGGYLQDQFHLVYHPMWVNAVDGKMHYGTVFFDPFGTPGPGMVLTALKRVRTKVTAKLQHMKPTMNAIELQEEHLRIKPRK